MPFKDLLPIILAGELGDGSGELSSESSSYSASTSESSSESSSTSESSSESSSESEAPTDTTMNLTVKMTRQDALESVGGIDQLTIGSNRQGGTITLGPSEVTIEIESSIYDAGLLYCYNHDAAAYVDIGYATGVYRHRVDAGNPGLIPIKPTITLLYVVASVAGTKFEYELTERYLV